MEFLASLFVQRPLTSFLVAAAFGAAWLLLRNTAWGTTHRPSALLIPAAAWLLYAAWEWAIHRFSPEANIRVDLLIIWPVLALVSAWFIFRATRSA